MRTQSFLVGLALLAACGDDGGTNTPPPQDASGDDAPTVDADLTDCNYTEKEDAANGETSEDTGLFIGEARTTLCGTFASDHFDGDITVDEDRFTVTSAANLQLLVRLNGSTPGVELAGVDVYSGTTLVGAVTYYGDHGVAQVTLPAGTFELNVFALATEAISAPLSYTVEIMGDTPDTRCTELTTGGYAEANDGPVNTGNDVYSIPSGAPIALTPSAADAAEPTGLTLDSTPTRFTGSAADVAVADQYEDRDAFAFRTNGTINEMTVRLTWPGGANLDYLLFEGTALQAEYRAITTSTSGPEMRTYSIKPSRDYTLLVAAKPGGTLPVAYTATLCGVRYEP